jgi:hypothetical protein
MANYCAFTKMMMDDQKSKPKSKPLFHSSSWIYQSKDVKKEIPQEDTKKLKMINNYEIKCVYKINMNNYYKNVPIYLENRNKYIPNAPKTKK